MILRSRWCCLALCSVMVACGDSTILPVDGDAIPPDLTTGGPELDLAGTHAPPPDLTSHALPPDLATAPHAISLVITIVLENHDYAEVVGSPNAPYINSLIKQYGSASNYFDSGSHPSEPNYLYLISGSTQGDPNDVLPTAKGFPVAGDNLGNQLQTAGVKWRAYQESMGTPCKLTNSGNYAPKHNPFVYFSDIQKSSALCAAVDVDYSSFAADLAAGTYQYMWITPNLLDDGHNPTTDPVTGLKGSDAWLQTELPKIIASSAFQAGGVLFLTWDEAEGRNGDSKDQIPMIVISPFIKSPGYTSSQRYDHASYLATVEDLFKLPRLGAAQQARNMLEFIQ